MEKARVQKSWCAVCEGSLDRFTLPFPVFRHSDFSTVSNKLSGWLCQRCDLLQRLDTFASECDQFKRGPYQLSRQTVHRVSKSSGQNRSRSELQAKYLSEWLPGAGGRLLDVGCFDGVLLRYLHEEKPSLNLVGYDVNPIVIGGNLGDSVTLTDNSDTAFSGCYDAVTFSHSIMYVDDLPELLKNCKALLVDSGFLFIQLPDIQINPLYTLMGDQAFIFNEQSLGRLLSAAGFEPKRHFFEEFGRDLLLTAHHADVPALADRFDPSPLDSKTIYEDMSKRINGLIRDVGRSIKNQKVHILGTTIFAAFIHELMPDNVIGFVDENQDKDGTEFRGLPVHHPRANSPEQRILVEPMSDGMLEERLNRLYSGRFFSH